MLKPHIPILLTVASIVAGCSTVERYVVPEGKPTAVIRVNTPPGSDRYNQVAVYTYKQPESCIGSDYMKESTAEFNKPAVNVIEAGKLQTLELSFFRRGYNGGRSLECQSRISFIPEAGANYTIDLIAQGMTCAPKIQKSGPNGTFVPVEHKIRTPAPGGFTRNQNGDCADPLKIK